MIAALVILVQEKKLYITDRPVYKVGGNGQSAYYWKSLLPAIGSIVGSINAYIAGGGIALLVASYAKHQGLNKGLSLKKISHLGQLAAAGVPLALSPLFVVGITVAAALSLTNSSIVQAFTPTLVLFDSPGSCPLVSFHTVADTNVRCDYVGRGQGFGYGENCPVNDKYGIMFDVGVSVLSNDVPENYTRRGVSYPRSLSGLSGRVSTMASDVISKIVGDSAIMVTSETVAVSCLPRTKVTAVCKTNLDGTGLSYTNLGETSTSFWFKTQQMQFCNSAGTCTSDYRTNFNDGTVFVFAENKPHEGSTSLLLVATGNYATDLGTPQLFCRVSAEETFLPIRVQGFTADKVEGYSCPLVPQSAAVCQDGRLEILGLINNTQGRTKGEMLEGALEKMLEVGATEMYTHLPTNNANLDQTCTLQTPRTVLGSRTAYGYLWAIPPGVLASIFLIGWITLGFRRAAQAYWSPLDPGCMAVSGVAVPKNSSLYTAVNRLAGASTNHINEFIQGPLRLAEVDIGHLALTMDDQGVAPVPQTGKTYGAPSAYTPTSTQAAMSPEIKPFTPMMTPDQAAAYQGQQYASSNNGSYFPAGAVPLAHPPYYGP
ncbi:hypothetical protein QFC19_006170 [Naganishia cerealis]|uniref:Uncharacterized protein n=1 Tax=Naganishia cerealis TaxID=610337 RepID=A0ACC2VIL0_9TREE|nr:hypothetical protein QFC19_006170 [Naganishia cerealis]